MKIVYNIIKSLRPHFFSLREIDENVSLDIKIPTNWKFENIIKQNDNIPFAVKVQDKKTTNSLISLIAPSTSEGYEYVFNYAKAVISINKEEEEKEQLFKEKVNELKSLFLSTSLDKLKEISFTDELSDSKRTGEIGLGAEEGTGTDEQN